MDGEAPALPDGEPIKLTYAPPVGSAAVRPWLRALIAVVVMGWTWFFVAYGRTMETASISTLGDSLVLAAIFGAAPAALVWLGLPWRRWAVALLLTLFIPVTVAETMALVEEQLFLRNCRALAPNTPCIVKDRFWPFQGNALWYDPPTGQYGAHD
jgi:hypothetical protein